MTIYLWVLGAVLFIVGSVLKDVTLGYHVITIGFICIVGATIHTKLDGMKKLS